MRYMVIHKLTPGLTREKLSEIGKSFEKETSVKGYRSFLNLTEGLGVCLFDSPDKNTLQNVLKRLNLSYDSITEVELEGERGKIVELTTTVGTTT